MPSPYAPGPAYQDAGLALVNAPFSGVYVGASAGVTTTDRFDFDSDLTGFSGAVQAGYLHQMGMFVLGAEIEAAYLNGLQYQLTPGSGLSQDWSIAAKARAGVAIQETLLYGTVGYGMTNFDAYGLASYDKDIRGGVVFGGGLEQAFGNFSVRAEYLQSRLDGVESTVGGVGQTNDLVNHTVKIGANYRF